MSQSLPIEVFIQQTNVAGLVKRSAKVEVELRGTPAHAVARALEEAVEEHATSGAFIDPLVLMTLSRVCDSMLRYVQDKNTLHLENARGALATERVAQQARTTEEPLLLAA